MAVGKIEKVAPKMKKDRTQDSFSAHGNTMYVYLIKIEGSPTGEVNSLKPDEYPIPVGTDVEFSFHPSDDTRFMGKYKGVKKVEGSSGSGAPSSQAQSAHPSNRDTSITVQAVLKSVIESGADPKDWGKLVKHGLFIHDEAVEMRSSGPKPVQQPPAPRAAAPPQQQPIGQENEDWSGDPPF